MTDFEPLVVLGARGGGGSGKGISYYQKLLGCINRATLSAGEDNDSEDSEDSAVGKAGHALLEHYHLDRGGVALPFQSANADPAVAEALRLFAAYRDRYSPSSLGEVLGCEVPLAGSYAGVEVTARLDMVVQVDEDTRMRIFDQRGIMLDRDGVYIVDHKFKKANTRDLVPFFQTSPQFPHYMNLWNEAHPENPAVGALVNVIFRYKTVSDNMFKLIPVQAPEPADIEFVKGIVRDGDRNLRERGPHWKNPIHCFDFHRTCPHFWYCDRTNK